MPRFFKIKKRVSLTELADQLDRQPRPAKKGKPGRNGCPHSCSKCGAACHFDRGHLDSHLCEECE